MEEVNLQVSKLTDVMDDMSDPLEDINKMSKAHLSP
jgi:hypothetical protein